MNTRNIILSALTALLLLPACNRMEKTSAADSENGIRFAAPVQTKATDAASTDAVFQVRDWYNDTGYHIENSIRWDNGASKWVYGTADTYKWSGGTHLFFGWLDHDNSYSTTAFFGTGISTSANTLILPAKTLGTSVAQYDFLFSNPVFRSTADNDYSDVPLIFNHLFAQVAISFKISDETPNTEEPIQLYGVYLNDYFKNSKETTISFNTDGTADVNFTNISHVGNFSARVEWGAPTPPMSFGKGDTPIDVLSQRQVNTKDYYYVWPAEESELSGVIDVVYKISGETDIRTSRLSFPKGTSWEGGHKYSYTITYMGGIFKVEESVLPWNYSERAALAEEQSVIASFMGWDSATCSVSGTNVSFKTDEHGKLMPIHGMFKIFSPTQCTYFINMTQNATYYTISPNTGTIGTADGDTYPGVNIDFYITADDDDRPAAGSDPIRGNLSFSVQASGGRDYSLDSELQHDGAFTIIIPSM